MDCGTAFVIDRDPGFCVQVEELLAREGFEVRRAHDGQDALALLDGDGDPPALAIVEVELPGLDGLTLLSRLHEGFGTDLPVVLVSEARQTPLDRTAGLLLGADDYLGKPVDSAELLARVRRSVRRNGHNGNGNGNGNGRAGEDAALSRREQEILELLAAGRTQREIATELVLSPKTVATHIQHVLAKLGVHSRAQAVAAAYQRGLVPENGEGRVAPPLARSLAPSR